MNEVFTPASGEAQDVAPLRVLVMSMWPSAPSPEFGVFVRGQVSALRKLGLDVQVAKLREQRSGKLRTPMKYLRLSWDAQTLGADFQSEVIHGHYLLPTGLVTRRVARKLKLPYVVTAHGSDVAGCERSPKIKARTERVVRDAAAVIAVSDDLARRLESLFPGVQPVVSHMGFDSDIFKWQEHGGSSSGGSKGPLVVAVGSLSETKNHARLIEAAASIDGMRLVIIGEGPQRATLEALIEGLGVGSRIALAGRVPLYELPAWYARADACALVSTQEGFGLAPLEGTACGARPVVSRGLPIAPVLSAHGAAVEVDPLDADSIRQGLADAIAAGRVDQSVAAMTVAGHDTISRAREVMGVLSRVVGRP